MKKATLARTVGVTPAAVEHWESGRSVPTMRHAAALADVLGITIDRLMRRAS